MEEGGLAKGTSTVAKVFNWVLTISMAGGLITTYVDPSIIMDMATEEVIHDDVEALKDTIKADLLIEFKDKIAKSDREHAACNTKLVGLQSQVNKLKDELEARNTLIEGLDKQTNFNTHNTSTNAEAIFELMKNDESCQEVRYTRNSVDRYVLWENDWYNHPTLQRITAGSGCRVTINAFDRDRIRKQYTRR